MNFSITAERWNNIVTKAAPVIMCGIAFAAVATSHTSSSDPIAKASAPEIIKKIVSSDAATTYNGACGGAHFQFATKGPTGESVTNFDVTAIRQLSSFRGSEEYLVAKIAEQVLPPPRDEVKKALADSLSGKPSGFSCG